MTHRCLLIAGLVLNVLRADEYYRDLTKPKDAEQLYQVHRGNKWGFIDARGSITVRPQFDNEGHFFNGLARVEIAGLWGFINESGRIVVPLRYASAGDFHDGLAPVRVGRKWGYVDQKGGAPIAPAFQGAGSFREGLARVEAWERIQCAKGKTYTKDQAPEYLYSLKPEFGDSGIDRCFPLDPQMRYIDKSGRLLASPPFLEADDFFEGLAAVRASQTGKYGFINSRGIVVVDFQFDEVGHFAEGIAWARVGRRTVKGIRDPGQVGYIDHSGKFTIKPQFSEAGDFSEGLAPVSFFNQLERGYIDRTGKLVIPPRYIWAEPFSEGLARACNEVTHISWVCAYIDHTGRTVINTFQAMGPFSGGLAVAQERYERNRREVSRQVYIDKRGSVIAPTEIESSPPGDVPRER